MTMRVLVAAFSFLLLTDFCLVTSVEKNDSTGSVFCCHTFVNHRVPQSLLIGFVMTSSQCPKPAALFETKQGLKICANPAVPWVKRYMKKLS